MITAHATSVFLNTDQFAEPTGVVYHPFNYPGRTVRESRTINAVVIREQVELVGENDSVTFLPTFEVHVANDSTLGISGVEIDFGGDQIAFATRDGMDASRHAILRILTQDHGMLVLECR